MKKITLTLIILLISAMSLFAQAIVIEKDTIIYQTIPKFGTTAANSVPLVTSNQVNITPRSISSNLVFSSSMTNNVNMSISNNLIDIISGRLYVSNTNGLGTPAVFSRIASLTIANTGSPIGGKVLGRFSNMGMVCTLLMNSCAVGATNIYVADNSGFAADNLLYLMGSNEFASVESLVGTTNVILQAPLLYGHSVADGVSRVREFGSFQYEDATVSNLLYSTVKFPTDTIVNMKLDVRYK